jgi:hypothetical protein
MHHHKIREILILSDPQVVEQWLAATLVFNEMTVAFSDCGIPVRTITSVKELHNDAIVFVGDKFRSEDPATIIAKYAENAIYVLWYWHDRSTSSLKNVIHIYEDKRNAQDNRRSILEKNRYHCPFLLRASETPALVGTYTRNVIRDYFFAGTPYKPEWVPSPDSGFTGIYHGVHDMHQFLDYNTRRNLYLSSHFALGFQSDISVIDKTVGQRIYEGMAYGCIVLTNSDGSVEQTEGIAVKVNSAEDVIHKMKWFLANPDVMESVRQRGYDFVRRLGTNHNAKDLIMEQVNRIYQDAESSNFIIKMCNH